MTARAPIRFNETVLVIARAKSMSLRTTILAFIGGKLELKSGDKITWTCIDHSIVRVEKGNGECVSTLTQAGPSLRTTIPQKITKILGLNQNDVLVWDLDKECKDGMWYAVIGKRRMC